MKPRDEYGDPIRPEDVLSDEEAAEVRRKERQAGKKRHGPLPIPQDPWGKDYRK
jgi:hypothetical protein